MQTKRIVLSLAGLAVLVVGWALFRPERLWINQSVSEGLNAGPATAVAAPATDAPKVLASGAFHSGAHETSGDATIHAFADGRRVLRLTNFKTSNGPDVQVLLVAANDVKDDATVKSAGFVRLAGLKGNVGDQNYDVPADVDLSRYRSVTIWCRRFGVNFGTAPLSSRS